jgi:hypothetical protein
VRLDHKPPLKIMRFMKYNNKNKYILLFLFLPLFLFLAYSFGNAKVTGVCANCHTMHNSQNGTAMATDRGSYGTPPYKYLVRDTCVGCHTSTSGQTIINIGGSKIPIVFNTGGYPTQPLAGGNFYYVSKGGAGNDVYGHNVYGISGSDNNLSTAPGRTPGGCANSCHDSLAAPPSTDNYDRAGCQGCHVFTYHHEDNGVYRYLKGHGAPPIISFTDARKNISAYPDYVIGVEDPDWEQETVSDHNYYKGTNVITYISEGDSLTTYKTITAFCSGCHNKFHGPIRDSAGMGSSSPWLRHPTDIALPTTGEYSAYKGYNAYSTEAPVAFTDPSNPSDTTAIVMCLSCHRAHGSPYPDILRWDYAGMIAGTTGPTAGTGCFTCHTTKDGL